MNLLVNFKRVAMAWGVFLPRHKRRVILKSHSMQMSNEATENPMLAGNVQAGAPCNDWIESSGSIERNSYA